jgi:hypothetical protein
VAWFSQESSDFLMAIDQLQNSRDTVVRGALQLASSEFQLAAIRERFWTSIGYSPLPAQAANRPNQ